MNRWFILAGAFLIIIGIAWPWLGKLPIGRLPGDIIVSRPNLKFYFPIATMAIISIILSLILWLLKK
ncbi:MAG: DUF2905 domain-containing protein [Desulfobacterales bacterium]|jgi:hypothetical protein|nr:DUF2905 domain-containing protein [Desulfobacterales bacterium]